MTSKEKSKSDRDFLQINSNTVDALEGNFHFKNQSKTCSIFPSTSFIAFVFILKKKERGKKPCLGPNFTFACPLRTVWYLNSYCLDKIPTLSNSLRTNNGTGKKNVFFLSLSYFKHEVRVYNNIESGIRQNSGYLSYFKKGYRMYVQIVIRKLYTSLIFVSSRYVLERKKNTISLMYVE